MRGPEEVERVEHTVYRELAHALDRLPQGFPSTDSGIEIDILQILFTIEEARIAAVLSDRWETTQQIAVRLGTDSKAIASRLRLMRMKELVQSEVVDGERWFRLNHFIVGSWEATMFRLDGDVAHRLAHLSDEYMASTGGLAGIMTPNPALHRVVPSRSSVKSEWILPYDDIKAVLLEARSFFLRDCVCRKAQDLLEQRKCCFSRRACLSFSPFERPAHADSISQAEAIAFLDEAEREGLVHTVSNVAKGINYVCNCCGCCCGVLRGIAEFGLQDSVAHANYYVEVNPDLCSACGLCTDRCQTHAVQLHTDDQVKVDRRQCIGCGLCVTTCPSGALQLQLKPAAELLAPPADIGSWERLRKANRGME